MITSYRFDVRATIFRWLLFDLKTERNVEVSRHMVITKFSFSLWLQRTLHMQNHFRFETLWTWAGPFATSKTHYTLHKIISRVVWSQGATYSTALVKLNGMFQNEPSYGNYKALLCLSGYKVFYEEHNQM